MPYAFQVKDDRGDGIERPFLVRRYQIKKIIRALDRLPDGRGGGVATELESRLSARLDRAVCPECGETLTPKHLEQNPSCAETVWHQWTVLLASKLPTTRNYCGECGRRVMTRDEARRERLARAPDYAAGRF